MSKFKRIAIIMVPAGLVCTAILIMLTVGRGGSARGPELPCTYRFWRESSGWRPEVWINGQPAMRFEQRSSDAWSMTPFVLDGDNQVRIIARRDKVNAPFGVREECSLLIDEQTYSASGPQGKPLHRLIVPPEDERDTVEDTWTFAARVPIRWRWQDADDLAGLSDQDRAAILAIFNQLTNALRAYDADQLRSLFALCWDGPRLRVAGRSAFFEGPADIWENNVAILRGNPVYAADEKEMAFAVGTKVVMLYCSATAELLGGIGEKPLLSMDRTVPVGTNQPEGTKWVSTRESLYSQLHFIRIEGQWLMMMPNWDL